MSGLRVRRNPDVNLPVWSTNNPIFSIVKYPFPLLNGTIIVDSSYFIEREAGILKAMPLNGVIYRFDVHPLHINAFKPEDRVDHLTRFKTQESFVQLSAEWRVDSAKVSTLLENAIEANVQPPDATHIIEQLLGDGYACRCHLINILRRKYNQYWIGQPNDWSSWRWVNYFSNARNEWFRFEVAEDFTKELLEKIVETKTPRKIVVQTINSEDIDSINSDPRESQYTFAEEMIATALVELGDNRIRSAILHAGISLESCAKTGLDLLLERRLKGLDSDPILEAIAKEINTALLAQVVFTHFAGPNTDANPDWNDIADFWNTRNQIVHRRRRNFNFEIINRQVIEIYQYVQVSTRLYEAKQLE